jgi:L-alanine-DL-glutamate epimerase-like enolase superfamily enzyme
MGNYSIPRRVFMRSAAATGAALVLGTGVSSQDRRSAREVKEQAFLRRVEIIDYKHGKDRSGNDIIGSVLRVTTTDGVVGGHIIEGWVKTHLGLHSGYTERLQSVLEGKNILDHEGVWSACLTAVEGRKSKLEIVPWCALDAACWDVHARMKNVPLYDLLGGKKRDSYPCYGDERWAEGMTAEQYARNVEKTAKSGRLLGTKLHLPGAHHKSISVDYICEALRKIRQYCGDEFMVAYDPHPEKESADNIDDARKILTVLDECHYGWLEGALPIEPKDQWLPQWLELRKEFKTRMQIEQAELDYCPGMMDYAEAGAINLMTADDRYWGVTGIVRLIDWIRKNPEKDVRLNLHKNASQVNRMVTASLEPEIAPWIELTGASKDGRQSIPDWIGITNFDWKYIERNKT